MGHEAVATLESAFKSFNQLSTELTASYNALQARFELLSALPAGVVVLDGSGRVREHNAVAAELLGEPLRGELWHEVAASRLAALEDAHEFRLGDGRRVHVRASALAAARGQIVLVHDVTETRRLQEHLSRHQRLTEMGEMAASLAHQIRTPLAAAMLYAGPLAASGERAAGKVLASLRQLERMVNDMLLFARGGGSAREEIVLPEFFREVQLTLEPLLAGAKCTLSCEAPALVLYGNRDALMGALHNLAMNAMQACGAGGTLRLSATVSDDACVHLAITDNGPGIPLALHERIFEPFFTTRASGTGLGLAVVRAVARAHGGDAWVRSQPGGSTFGLRLPMAQAGVALQSGLQT